MDQINGCFEVVAGLLLWMNVAKLYRDKQLLGVCLLPTIFMMIWGVWNLFFYPAIGAHWSYLGESWS